MPAPLIAFALSLMLAGAVGSTTAGDLSSAVPSGNATSVIGSEEAARLIGRLEDPDERARLIRELRALTGAEARLDPPTPAQQPAPEAGGAQVLQALSQGVGAFGTSIEAAMRSVADWPRLGTWLHTQFTSPERQSFWTAVLVGVAMVLGSGLVAGAAARLAVWRLRARLVNPGEVRVGPRAMRLLGYTLVELVPVAAFAGTAYAVLALVRPEDVIRLIALAVVNAVLFVRLGCVIAALIFSPFAPSLRLFRMDGESAAYAYIWIRRLFIAAVYGYSTLQLAVLVGLPARAYAVLLNVLGLIVALLIAVILMQNRDSVARLIRGAGDPTKPRIARVRGWLARYWHVLALAYLVIVYLVWATEIRGGFGYVLRGTLLSIAVVVLAHWAIRLAGKGIEALLQVNRQLLQRYPMIESRVNRYTSLLRRVMVVVVQVVAVLAMLASWRIDVGAVVGAIIASEFAVRIGGVVLILALAALGWEVIDGMIAVYLERRDAAGHAVAIGRRARTLLPLLRNVVWILISVLAVLTVLSQIGLNIGPLLASVGIVGLAVGFGAQTLVKDVITGVFMLFEDTVNVGDVVSINNIGGLVEGMTIRTIRLRDLSGVVHTIPFSSITTVSNMTREYAYHLVDVGVGYGENTDEVVASLREVFEDLRKDPVLGRDIIGDLEVLGVDRFEDSAVFVRARIKTLPIRQWDVGREFNRRMKQKFDAAGIAFAAPRRLVQVDRDAVEGDQEARGDRTDRLTDQGGRRRKSG